MIRSVVPRGIPPPSCASNPAIPVVAIFPACGDALAGAASSSTSREDAGTDDDRPGTPGATRDADPAGPPGGAPPGGGTRSPPAVAPAGRTGAGATRGFALADGSMTEDPLEPTPI